MNAATTREIMNDAWALYHAAVAEDPAAATRTTFSLSLRYAWERHPARYAARIRALWAKQSPAEQLNSARKMSAKAAADHEARTGGAIPWGIVEPQDVASETWALMQARVDTLEAIQSRRNRLMQVPLSLSSLLYRAAAEALRSVLHEAAVTGWDTYTPEWEATAAAPDDPAQTTIIHAALESVKTPEQRAVLALLLQGETVRSIAAQLGRSKSAVQRTIDRIRAQVSAALAA